MHGASSTGTAALAESHTHSDVNAPHALPMQLQHQTRSSVLMAGEALLLQPHWQAGEVA